MIYTISLNSSIDYTFYTPGIRYDDINRIDKSRIDPGGKGLNVARMLTVLGCDCEALTFIGGQSGEVLKALLEKEGIRYRCVRTKGSIRSIYNFFSADNEVLRFNERGPEISPGEKSAFLKMLAELHLKKKRSFHFREPACRHRKGVLQ